ncbi:MAG: dihydrolipoamide acetyltransferase family protein [Rhodoglobus sp.]
MSDFTFLLPDVGEGLADAEIVRWLVDESQPVSFMDPLVEVETAKSVVEIPSPATGIVSRHGAAEGETLEVGAVLAVISGTEAAPAHPDPVPAAAVPAAPESIATREVAAPVSADRVSTARRVPAAPTVRRRAAELGIDLQAVTGTGPAGRVLDADLDAALTASAALAAPTASRTEAPAAGRVEKLSRMRSAIAGTLTTAWQQVPLITDMRDADAEGLTEARASLAQEMDQSRVSFTALFAYVTAAALRRYPSLNASLDLAANTVTYHARIDLGIAVSVPSGLSVAVVKDAGSLSLARLAEEVDSLVELARNGRLTPAQSTGATFTVSSFGKFGGWYGTPLVVPPQVAIAGFGPIKDKVVPYEGVPAIRKTLAMSVSADHRLIDGAELSQFCSYIEKLVAHPVLLLGA